MQTAIHLLKNTIITTKVRATDKQISRTFRGFFKDKLQFSRTKIHVINRHSLTPFWSPCWLKHVIESFTIFTSSAIVVSFAAVIRVVTRHSSRNAPPLITLFYTIFHNNTLQNDWVWLTIASEVQNTIWNKETEMKYCSCTLYSWVLEVLTQRMSQIFFGKIILSYINTWLA